MHLDSIFYTDIMEIINEHFDECEKRIDTVNRKYFRRPREVLKRHWRNKKDIPSDLVIPVKLIWNFGARKILGRKIKPIPKTGKIQEVERIISEELLDMKGLERKIENHINPFKEAFEKELTEIIDQVPALKREKFTMDLEKYIERLNIPVEGSREAVMFLVAIIIAKAFSNQIVMTGLAGTGGLIATSIYMSQLSWFGALWVHLYAGVPGWVGYTGAAGGFLVGILAAPFIFPLLEIGINRVRSKKILTEAVQAARASLTQPEKDKVNTAGKIAIYLQTLPDILYYARKAVSSLI